MTSEDQQSITAWQDDVFGPTTPWLAYCRMADEVAELEEVFTRGRDIDHNKSLEECADVYIMLVRVAEALGGDLQAEVDRKMAINRARSWDVDGNGHGQHR